MYRYIGILVYYRVFLNAYKPTSCVESHGLFCGLTICDIYIHDSNIKAGEIPPILM